MAFRVGGLLFHDYFLFSNTFIKLTSGSSIKLVLRNIDAGVFTPTYLLHAVCIHVCCEEDLIVTDQTLYALGSQEMLPLRPVLGGPPERHRLGGGENGQGWSKP